jgi:hypothetical protein
MIFVYVKPDKLEDKVKEIKKFGHTVVSVSLLRTDGTHLISVLPGF